MHPPSAHTARGRQENTTVRLAGRKESHNLRDTLRSSEIIPQGDAGVQTLFSSPFPHPPGKKITESHLQNVGHKRAAALRFLAAAGPGAGLSKKSSARGYVRALILPNIRCLCYEEGLQERDAVMWTREPA